VKYLIKLLKAWTAPDGVKHDVGTVLEFEETDVQLVKDLIFDGTGEKTDSKDAGQDKSLGKTIADAVSAGVKSAIAALPKADAKTHAITTHDKVDDDMTWGYLSATAGREHTREEKEYGLGQFALDVFKAAQPGATRPKRLSDCFERRSKMLTAAVAAGDITKAAASGGLTVGDDEQAGALIPPEFSMTLMGATLETAKIRPRATTMAIGSDVIEMPQLKNYDHSSNNVYGGVQAYFKGENATLTQNAAKIEEVRLELAALTALAYASHKFMTFSPVAAGSWLLPKMAEAITWKEEDKFLNGTGVGMPLGIIGANATVSVAIETGQTLAATAVLTKNVVKMRQALKVARPSSVMWLYNQTDLLYWLSLLTVSVGTGGSTFGLIQQVTDDINFRMLGIPLIDTEHCQAAGTVGDLVLADWSEYIIADNRSGPEVAQSMHLQFDTGQNAFRIIKYVAGQPRYSAKFTRQNSTNQCAPYVTLAART